MEDNKPPPPGSGGGNGQSDKPPVPDTCGDNAGKPDSSRRRRRGTEDETKEEIGSLAAASGFNISSRENNTTARNNNMPARVVQPGAYAVDGPDHGSASTDANSHTNSACAQSVQSGSAAGSDANQSGNSAVAEVRAALAAEREAARLSGIGTRRPSLRGSMRSSIASGISVPSSITSGVGGASEPIRTDSINENGSGAFGVGVGVGNGTQGDLANHPAIEFLAEATLVESEGHSKDTEDSSQDHDDVLGDDMTTGDISTLGPPSELVPLSRNQKRSTSNGSANSRRSNDGSRQDRRNRQRRPARPTDPFAEVPMATCTSVDENRGSSHHFHSRYSRNQSRDSVAGVIDEEEEGGDDCGATCAMSRPPADVLMAEPLKNKCLLPRRTVVVGVVAGLVILLGVVLGVTLHVPDEDVDTTYLYPASKFNPPDDEVLTTVPAPICYSLLPVMSNISDVCTDPVVDFPQGGQVPQLIADGLFSASDPDANIDIVLFNGGGVRSDICANDLTAGFVRNMVMPFINNRVAYLSVTPADIYHTLNAALFDTGFVMTEEKQKRNGESPTVDVTWPYEFTYPYAAGLRFDVDLNAPEGEKATDVRIRASSELRQSLGGWSVESLEKDDGGDEWIALDPTDDTTLIRVLSPDFLAGGGDGFFQTVPKERVEIEESLGVTQLFEYYCSLQSELMGPTEMSTQRFVPLEGYEEGYQ